MAATSITLPLFSVMAEGTNPPWNRTALSLPLFNVQTSGGGSTRANLVLPLFEVTAGGGGRISATLPRFNIDSSGLLNKKGTVELTLPQLFVRTESSRNQLGDIQVLLPLFRVTLSSHTEVEGSVSILLPLFSIATAPAHPVEDYQTLVFNVKNEAVVEYSDFAFNSYCRVNGVCYAAGDEGVVRLGGNKAGAADIQSVIDFGVTDFSDYLLPAEYKKKVPELYLNMRSDDQVILYYTVNEDADREEYQESEGTADGKLQMFRVPMAKGMSGTNWTFKLYNIAGGYFGLSDMMVPVNLCSRKLR